MPVKEQWGALVREDSPLAGKDFLRPRDLVGIPLICATGEFLESRVAKWLKEYAAQVHIIAKGNLLYNEAMLAQSNIGAVVGIRLHCRYDGLRFIPFSPPLTSDTALAWKKEQMFSAATRAFLEFAKKYLKSISDDKL